MSLPEVGVSELVALVNQSFDYAYPAITVIGELANLRVSKNRWVYFDLKDTDSSVKFFGTVYQLQRQILEDGMLVKVVATPHLHNLYGFSMNVQSIQPTGEGSIKKAAQLLQVMLQTEGLFDESRKRQLPHPPQRVGLIASNESAAYADFTKIVAARWPSLRIVHRNVQVQGEPAIGQIVAAVQQFNALAEPPEVLVLIRGGGSPEDLAAFSSEVVTRAVAASRIPTLVAIGHESDISLAELAADMRASTPSNAAELLVPDRYTRQVNLEHIATSLTRALRQVARQQRQLLTDRRHALGVALSEQLRFSQQQLQTHRQLLEVYDLQTMLKRGYAIIRNEHQLITSVKKLRNGQTITLQLQDGRAEAIITGTIES